MGLDRDVISTVRALSDPELRRLVMLAQDLLAKAGPDEQASAAPPTPPGLPDTRGRVPDGVRPTYRLEEVRCGKANCTRCPHGPYWYAYWRADGRVRSRYLGSARGEGVKAP